MSDEGEGSDGGEGARPSAPPSARLPRGSPSTQRPLDLFSSASPLLGDTDPPYLASPESLRQSPERREPGGSARLTPPKLLRSPGDAGSPCRGRRGARTDAGCDGGGDPLPKWRGRGAADAERLQHRGQRLHRAPELPELSDLGNHHHSAEHADPEFTSETRQT